MARAKCARGYVIDAKANRKICHSIRICRVFVAFCIGIDLWFPSPFQRCTSDSPRLRLGTRVLMSAFRLCVVVQSFKSIFTSNEKKLYLTAVTNTVNLHSFSLFVNFGSYVRFDKSKIRGTVHAEYLMSFRFESQNFRNNRLNCSNLEQPTKNHWLCVVMLWITLVKRWNCFRVFIFLRSCTKKNRNLWATNTPTQFVSKTTHSCAKSLNNFYFSSMS